LLYKSRDWILDPKQPFPKLRDVYWTPFSGTNEEGRAFYFYRSDVAEKPHFVATFLATRAKLQSLKANDAELRYFDGLAAERMARDPKARSEISAQEWDRLLTQTAFGNQEWVERFAPFLGPAEPFIRRAQMLKGRLKMTQTLIETFISFDPTLDEFRNLKATITGGWQQVYIKWFAEQYLHSRADEATVFEFIGALPSLGAAEETIYDIAKYPAVVNSIRSVQQANRWLEIFANDFQETANAYPLILEWIQTPAEFNALTRPGTEVLSRGLTQYVREWRGRKKRQGWKFRWLESLSAFGGAVDNGLQRETVCTDLVKPQVQ
jgi:hypothetical protein